MADGSQKAVKDLTGIESLLVWNMQTGRFESAQIMFIDTHQTTLYKLTRLTFSDNTTVDIINQHGFWDVDLNKYVYIGEDATEYIGHTFKKQVTDADGNMCFEDVKLESAEIIEKYTTAYSPVTKEYLCYFVNGMLSMPGGIEGLFNIFEVNSLTMKYDEQAMQADIQQYGLFTYADFEDLISEEVFNAFNGQYLKVAIGKGLIDWDGITQLIERYSAQLG